MKTLLHGWGGDNAWLGLFIDVNRYVSSVKHMMFGIQIVFTIQDNHKIWQVNMLVYSNSITMDSS